MSRQSVDSGNMSVPSVATDRNGQTFMSRQARGITMIEYTSRQAGEHPRSGRRDNSFMPRRPYAGVAPAQPGPTPVASTLTSAGAVRGLHHLRIVKTLALYLGCGTKTSNESKFFRRHPGNSQDLKEININSGQPPPKPKSPGPNRPLIIQFFLVKNTAED